MNLKNKIKNYKNEKADIEKAKTKEIIINGVEDYEMVEFEIDKAKKMNNLGKEPRLGIIIFRKAIIDTAIKTFYEVVHTFPTANGKIKEGPVKIVLPNF